MKRYNLQQTRCTSSSHSHSISHSITYIVYSDTIQYHTIPSTTILQCFSFIGEIPWKILWLTQYHGSTKLLANKHPKKNSQGLRLQTPKWGNECTVNMGYKHSWTITSLNVEDQAPQPTISHLKTDHNNSITATLAWLCSWPWTWLISYFQLYASRSTETK